jgi:hypothetical protein
LYPPKLSRATRSTSGPPARGPALLVRPGRRAQVNAASRREDGLDVRSVPRRDEPNGAHDLDERRLLLSEPAGARVERVGGRGDYVVTQNPPPRPFRARSSAGA